MKNKNDLHALQKENRRLKAELSRAEKKLRSLSRDNARELTDLVSGRADRYAESGHYLGFILRSLRASSIYTKTRTLVKIFSRFRIVSFLVKLITSAVVFIETSAHVILVSTIALITLPITTVFGLVTFIIAFFGSNRANKRLASLPDGKDVYIFFPQNVKQLNGESFFKGWISETASKENTLVIIVSPAFWKKTGYVKGKYYLHCRQDAENVYMVRNYYFFSFRRNVLATSKATSIYMIH